MGRVGRYGDRELPDPVHRGGQNELNLRLPVLLRLTPSGGMCAVLRVS